MLADKKLHQLALKVIGGIDPYACYHGKTHAATPTIVFRAVEVGTRAL